MRMRFGSTLIIAGLLTTAVFASSAQAESSAGTGRFERCAVQHTSGVIIAFYTVNDQDTVQDVASACSYFISHGDFSAYSNHVNLNTLPGVSRVCLATIDATESLDVFAQRGDASAWKVGLEWCDAIGQQDGSSVEYD